MSKRNNNYAETPSGLQLNEINYNCTECSSAIEILNINENELTIEFQCLNTKNIHKKKMLIKDYIEKMKNFNICKIHNLKYECYCIDCNIHLCKECLKLRNHINHIKNNIIEIQPNKKELKLIEDIIKYFEGKIENLEKEKLKSAKKLNNKIRIYKNKLKERKELNSKQNENKMKKDLKIISDEYIYDIKNIVNKHKNEIKLRKYIYEIKINGIKNKYKSINEYNNTKIGICTKTR
jgi:hypothetical protein